ncbi:MAG TPA: metallophosphoesterase [Gemmatimonas sp.]|uniref:metallophosphoesterase n=1 Tax=Gemmatimonas sp. TaxID=1962908 RepID=UPI002ED87C19
MAPIVPGKWTTVLAMALGSAIPLLLVLRGFAGRHYPSAAERVWVLRPFWYLQVALPVLGLSALVGVVLGLPFGEPAAGGRWALAIAGSTLTAIALAGYVGSRWLVTKELVAEHPDMPAALDGLRIAQISDLHVGPHTPRGFLARVHKAVQDARPDLIAITGDQVDDHAPDVQHFTRAFGSLRAPLGVYAIAGNHDVYAGWRPVRAGMEAAGMTVLVNEAVPLDHAGARFWLAATGDPAATGWSRGGAADCAPDIGCTLANVPSCAFTIALAHNPALWPALAKRGVALTLSGHTHYGQFSIPRLGWSLASPFLKHAMGSYREQSSLLYINPGTNYWGLPLRIGALPEVTVITLRRSSDSTAIRPLS